MRLLTLLFGLIVSASPVMAQDSSTTNMLDSEHYIADDLFIFIHSGPSRNYRILGSIEAGEPVTVLETDSENEFTKINDADGREGWVESQYIIDTISRRAQLPQLSQRLADSSAQLDRMQTRNTAIAQDLAGARQQIAELEAELANSRQTIAGLEGQISKQDDIERYRMFSYGGIVAGAGLLIGILVTFIPKRRRRNDSWM
ncbi:TIGR04211 family SH3 domain-containing protein [Alteromonas gilva]|uniref:TIGR04211 family SH3 domain-containing protein n=1 Tax=Alteromonas gilva TaxID=2987522 RepID=A0ABT5LAG3_9ALTE|nr:TIGR04211 family SH3 domain-containing protein [Alteromonas gilva]MDC8833093.1 TIGR04211 family SH3 domain-containing protein [Alteromonas gilva]